MIYPGYQIRGLPVSFKIFRILKAQFSGYQKLKSILNTQPKVKSVNFPFDLRVKN
jgi:hypothetical protein